MSDKTSALSTPRHGADYPEAGDYVFTFGFSQRHPLTDMPLDNAYVRVFGLTWDDARDQMAKRFGRTWAFQYRNEDEAGVQEYGLAEIGGQDALGYLRTEL